MLIDYERAWLELRQVVMEKRSHGQDQLLRSMADIEQQSRVPEGQESFSSLPAHARRSPANEAVEEDADLRLHQTASLA